MKLIHGLHNLPSTWSGSVVAIGNFDGLHLGHQQLISACVAMASQHRLPAVLMTFEPYPQAFFSKGSKMPRLMGLRDKYLALQDSGIDYLCVLPFNRALAEQSPEVFVRRVLVDQLKVKAVVVGDDFRFGAKRAGDFTSLEQLGKSCRFETKQIPTCTYDHQRISSSWLRSSLQSGDLGLARHLLGRSYRLSGRVVSGDRRGQDFGFPTANIYVGQQYLPIEGIFVVQVTRLSQQKWGSSVELAQPLQGVASVGKRPMYPSEYDMLEVFLLDFDQSIYGEHLSVDFLHKLRDELCFESEAELIAQIEEDVRNTKTYFSDKKRP